MLRLVSAAVSPCLLRNRESALLLFRYFVRPALPGSQEVDFYYILEGKGHLLNVSYEIGSPATREREIRGLVEAMKRFSLKEGSVVTSEHKEIIKTEAGKINVIPLWEWLLTG